MFQDPPASESVRDHQRWVAFHLGRLRRFVSLERTWEMYLGLNEPLRGLVDHAIQSELDDCQALGSSSAAERILARRQRPAAKAR